MSYRYAPPVRQYYDASQLTPLDKLYNGICNLSYDYVSQKRGRGPSHLDAYREGAKKAIELLMSGNYQLTITKKRKKVEVE